MISKRRREKGREYARNFFLVVLAISVVVIFFNLDIMRKGESVFSKSADKKLKFGGDMKRTDYTKKEVARLLKLVKKYNDSFESVFIEASPQDTYKKTTPTTQVIFEIHVKMKDGSTLSTPARRTKRRDLVSNIIVKLNKDMKAYLDLKKKGKKIKSLVNTM